MYILIISLKTVAVFLHITSGHDFLCPQSIVYGHSVINCPLIIKSRYVQVVQYVHSFGTQRLYIMGRVFAYCRVSTNDQNPENQKLEILNSGFSVEPKRFVEEKISGSVYASRRPEFIKLLDRLEEGDSLVVTKLDRLGRNALDVRQTIDLLAERGVKVHCLALGSTDLTSSSGKMTMTILSAVAEFERDLIIERTQSGLERAKAEGKKLGRNFSLNEVQQQSVMSDLNSGKSVSETARKFKTSRQTILRIRNKNNTTL